MVILLKKTHTYRENQVEIHQNFMLLKISCWNTILLLIPIWIYLRVIRFEIIISGAPNFLS